MNDYSFRIRLVRSPSTTLDTKASSVDFEFAHASGTVTLSSAENGKSIHDARRWALRGSGWTSAQEAQTAGNHYRDALMVTLARLRVGADFGNRAPRSAMTGTGLALMEERTGARVLNDIPGLSVFKTMPAPLFVYVGTADAIGGISEERFRIAFAELAKEDINLSEREQLSYQLFNASFFQQSAEARFLMLMIAIEALLEPVPRSAAAVTHVDQMVEVTRSSQLLSENERNSLLGSLKWLRSASINQMGRSIADARLGARKYMEYPAPKFFRYCYELRSRLVHGSTKFPSRDEIGRVAATLEVFVSDLLTAPILPLDDD